MVLASTSFSNAHVVLRLSLLFPPGPRFLIKVKFTESLMSSSLPSASEMRTVAKRLVMLSSVTDWSAIVGVPSTEIASTTGGLSVTTISSPIP